MNKLKWLAVAAIFVMVALQFTNPARTNPPAVHDFLAATSSPPGSLLFLKNCAHCHGADAHGDEGPDLHKLDWTDDQIVARIRAGKKGQMTAFAGKLTADQINEVKDYVRTLK
jgi:mono/diheme cytochrome c family protein